MRDISNKTHRAEHEIYGFCAKERDLGNIGQMRKSKRGRRAALLNWLKHDCLTNFKNAVDLGNVHTRSVGFLKGCGEGGGEEGQQFDCITSKSQKMEKMLPIIFCRTDGHLVKIYHLQHLWGRAYKCLCYCSVAHPVSPPNECDS